MEIDIIQAQFNSYIELLRNIHSLDHEIDAAVEETEITDIKDKRSKYKTQMRMKRKNLISLLGAGKKHLVYNKETKQSIMLLVVDGKLLYEKA